MLFSPDNALANGNVAMGGVCRVTSASPAMTSGPSPEAGPVIDEVIPDSGAVGQLKNDSGFGWRQAIVKFRLGENDVIEIG